ncbi:hypothetical protein [Thermomonas sp. HDW16]|uniref:hypothetical protein n=1 Tax=Thermomonas sp. HDW16 TaxID=2714945 RepID=UPI00140B605C|nr:hypothetical protein [Thermomonas sp. HDW16]QIL21376.1 hypothetical protein G7079_11890 [Thermomonas sp. HDW16]
MEMLLLLGIAAFYLFDSASLLYRDEVVFAQCGRRWRASMGAGFMLAGRYPVLPAVFSPGAPVFRASWGASAQVNPPATDVILPVLRPLRWPARLIALLLFLVLPLALWVNLDPRLMLGLLGVLYLVSSLSVAHVARRRSILDLSRKDIAAIAFDVIACPPFAINLVRRVTLRCGLAVPAGEFAATMLDVDTHARLIRVLSARNGIMAGDRSADLPSSEREAP